MSSKQVISWLTVRREEPLSVDDSGVELVCQAINVARQLYDPDADHCAVLIAKILSSWLLRRVVIRDDTLAFI